MRLCARFFPFIVVINVGILLYKAMLAAQQLDKYSLHSIYLYICLLTLLTL